jgi:hypothetical protein
MLNATLSTSFLTWHKNATDQHRKKAVCARIVLRVLKSTLSKSLLTWHQNATDEHRQKAVCARIVLRMLKSTLSNSLLTWHDNAITFRKKVHMVCLCARVCMCVLCVCVCVCVCYICVKRVWCGMQSQTNQIIPAHTQPGVFRGKSDSALDQQDTCTCLYHVV